MHHAFDIPKFLDWVTSEWAGARAQAYRASYSRSHYSRIVSRSLGEGPGELRRRLRLEAAAHMLLSTPRSVGEIAQEVGFGSPESLAKAFRHAYGITPSRFRAARVHPWLAAPSGIHFQARGMSIWRQGDSTMKFSELMIRHHVDETTRLLAECDKLTAAQLDSETIACVDSIPWDRTKPTLRDTMRAIVATDAIWLSALRGESFPDVPGYPSISTLAEVHAQVGPALVAFVNQVETEDLWGSEFVDALCEPPVTFQFAPVVAHILEFSAHRRLLVLSALRSLGVDGLEYGDPINWLREQMGEAVCVGD